MEDYDSSEPDNKRPHLNHVDPTAPHQIADAADLQRVNQNLVQQLELQKREMHNLQTKIQETKGIQMAYDGILITVNSLWNQLVGDLILLGLRAGGAENALCALDRAEQVQGSIPSCAPDQLLLCRLLEIDSIDCKENDGLIKYVEEALAARRAYTMDLMQYLEEIIEAQRTKIENIAEFLHGNHSAEDAIIQLSKIDDMMKEEAKNLHHAIDVLHSKHKEYTEQTQKYVTNHSGDQTEIKRLAGELEDYMAELEESKRKLVNLKMQKDVAAGSNSPASGVANGNLSPEKPTDRSKGLRELKESIDEAKILANDRLVELQDAQEYNKILSKQLHDLQNEVKDEKHVTSSKMYSLANDQLQFWNAQLERYKAMTEALHADRSYVTRKERDIMVKSESAEASRNSIGNLESRIKELDNQLQRCLREKNDLEITMEEVVQDSARKDIKDEFRVMIAALSKEKGTMKAQLNRWKDTAHEAASLHEQSQTLRDMCSKKATEEKELREKCDEQSEKIKFLKFMIEQKRKQNAEMEFVVDRHGQTDERSLEEIRESERRAHAQAEVLKNALNEHSLELRVKAAKEAEAACQQRLSAARTEIVLLREELQTYDRDVLELKEAIKGKDREKESYITEIETIGQAFEDMQAQNQHLLKMLAERDEYNIKVVSESVKMKQSHNALLSEKQSSEKQLEQVNSQIKSIEMMIAHREEQMKLCLVEAYKATQDDRHLALNLESTKWELTDAEKELKCLKSAVTSSEKESEQIQRRVNDVQAQLKEERTSKKKLVEMLEESNREYAELTSESGEAAVQKLQDEIKDCKAILKCGVCFDRPKEVVLLKCFHLFCNQCIQRNLEIRHRKCPGCGTAFGQSDVRLVKI
ncbi:hypothetical protein ACFE04_027756 [Oxalis oulophora]